MRDTFTLLTHLGHRILLLSAMETVAKLLKEYLDYDHEPRAYAFLEAWVEGTYIYRSFPAYPQVLMEQYVETGKSQTLEVCKLLSYKGQRAGYVTYASLRDLVNEGGSVFIDEFDRLDGGIKKIIKNGYKNGGEKDFKMVRGQDGNWVKEEYSIFCPKMFATNQSLDPKVKSRCILLDTYPSPRKYIPPIDEKSPKWKMARESIASLMEENEKVIMRDFGELTGPIGGLQFKHRERELWRPLIAIASSLNIPGVESLAVDMVKESRGILAGQRPDYMLLKVLEGEVVKPDYYRGTELDKKVLASLTLEEPPFWKRTTIGHVLRNLFPRLASHRDSRGNSYYITPDMVRYARAGRPL